VDGLQSVSAVRGRLQLKPARSGAWIIDDSYNANPGSVAAALEVLGDLPGPKWLVLADMAELGAHGERSHIEAGELARQHGVDRLFAAGPLSAHAAKSFGANAQWFPDVLSTVAPLQAELRAGTTVLIKGSRFNRLERVVEALMKETDQIGGVH
jgi:UDP-N-acetylmuramoyl-tripeptide--D-alanyl-D-alanine ligase